MIQKTDWETAYRELLEEGRQRLGEPPTADELLAFSRGKLPEAEALRIQELLSYYPEIAQALVEPLPFPEEIPPGHPAFLPDEVLEQDWEAIQARLAQAEAVAPKATEKTRRPRWAAGLGKLVREILGELHDRSLQLWRFSTLAAATLAVVLGGFLAWKQSEVQRLTRELEEPRVGLERRQLVSDGNRDVAPEQEPIVLRSEADHFLLAPFLIDQPSYPEYRIRIVQVDGKTEKEVWSASGLQRDGDTFEIWVPRAFLRSGDPYRIELYGVGKVDPLATYTVQLEEP